MSEREGKEKEIGLDLVFKKNLKGAGTGRLESV